MSSEQIDALLQNLQHDPEGWRSVVPEDFTFLGQPVGFFLQTEAIPRPPARQPNEDEIALTRKVLTHLVEILSAAEKAFTEHNAEHSEFIEDASEPHIWINEEAIELDGPERWSFIVNSKQNSYYGTHIVFDGTQLLEVWAGD
jgi:hypothetical protein